MGQPTMNETEPTNPPTDDEIDLIYSPHCKSMVVDDLELEVCIYSSEQDPTWVLEVVNAYNTSTIWENRFNTDHEALDEFHKTLEEEGVNAFYEKNESV